MSEKSNIEWTDATWNPVLGCSKISPGCKNCYAIRTAWRLQHNPNPTVKAAFEGLTVIEGGRPNWTGRVNFVEDRLEEPLHWREPRRIFVNSQSDLFHEQLSDSIIALIVAAMLAGNWHTYQVLTKRANRMLEWFQGHTPADCYSIAQQEDSIRRANNPSLLAATLRIRDAIKKFPGRWEDIKHIWWGTSVESQAYKDRIDHLRETPAAVRFLSLEPLLEDLGTLNLAGIHWVIVGGESGPNARPMHPDWARSIRDQCQAAGVTFFFKQWGEWIPSERGKPSELPEGHGIRDNSIGPERVKWMLPDGRVCPVGEGGYAGGYVPDGILTIRVSKKAAGRLLDGIEHSGYPQLQASKAEAK